jgi:hypothetical protein
MVDADEMIATPLKPKPCDHQVLDATLGAIEQHRCAVNGRLRIGHYGLCRAGEQARA